MAASFTAIVLLPLAFSAVLSQAQPVQEKPSSVDARALFKHAYAHPVPHEISYRRAAAPGDGITPEMIQTFLAIPGIEEYIDPPTSRHMLTIYRVKLRCDGLGGVRTESTNLLIGGPDAKRTAITLWSAGQTARVSSMDDKQALVRSMPPPDWQQFLATLKRGQLPPETERAQESVLCLAQHLIWVLENSTSTTISSAPSSIAPAAVAVKSDDAGMTAVIDAATGELLGAELAILGGRQIWTLTGALPEHLFPARHPREVRSVFQPAGADNPEPGDVLLVDSVKVLPAVDPAELSWKSVARSALDQVTGRVTDLAGNVTDAPRDVPSDPVPVVNADRTLSPSPSAWTRPWAWAATVVATCLLVLLGVWLRRRLA